MGGILSGNRHRTGDAIRGKEHLGKLTRPMGLEPVLLLSYPVDSRLGDRARIGVYHSCPKNPRPTFEPKESVAWKMFQKQ